MTLFGGVFTALLGGKLYLCEILMLLLVTALLQCCPLVASERTMQYGEFASPKNNLELWLQRTFMPLNLEFHPVTTLIKLL